MPEQPTYRNVLCIRADNMGDVIMSGPAMRALKESFGSRITLLTSEAGSLIVPYLDCVDELIRADLPWVKNMAEKSMDLPDLAKKMASYQFDAVIIFTVYSQSALPAAMLAYMAGIPVRVAYARENPYDLLTHWIPDHEPYDRILHQVERDLNLVRTVGAEVSKNSLELRRMEADGISVSEKLADMIPNANAPFLVLHPGVSEEKRQYPVELWIETGRRLAEKFNLSMLISGSRSEIFVAETLAAGIGSHAISVAGKFSLGEFIEVIGRAACVVSVNTSTIHIAAATRTPVAVLYAQTNPQHTPWQSPHEILPFSVPAGLRSRNPIIMDVTKRLYPDEITYPGPEEVVAAVTRLMS